MIEETRPLILTAKMDETAQSFFNAKRQEHFPPERNYLDAHITLFHKLPPQKLPQINSDITTLTKNTKIMSANAASVMFMGFGSAYVIECPPLSDLRNKLAKLWQDELSPQDTQNFKSHVTFQNKVKADFAKEIFEKEKAQFESFDFNILGLTLWYYNGGPWEFITDFEFSGV